MDEVRPWYRFNILIFANASAQQRLSTHVLATKANKVEDVGDLGWKLRKAAVRMLPRKAVNGIAAHLAARKR